MNSPDNLSADERRLAEIEAKIGEMSQSGADESVEYADDSFEEGVDEIIEDFDPEGSMSMGDESGSDLGQNSVLDVSVSLRSCDLLTKQTDEVFDSEKPDSSL